MPQLPETGIVRNSNTRGRVKYSPPALLKWKVKTDMSETEIQRIIAKMDSFDSKLNEVLDEIRNKEITCLRNQSVCQKDIAKTYIKIDDFPKHFNNSMETYHENNAKKLTRTRKMIDDVLSIVKWVVIIVGSGIGIKFFNVLGG